MTDGRQTEVALRLWEAGDLSVLERTMGDPTMTAHLGGAETPEKLRERNQRYFRMNDGDQGRMFVIVAGAERVPAGSVGYWEREWQGQWVWETGWSVFPEFQGKGIATLATLALVEQVRAAGKHRYLHAYPSVDNVPSNKVCEKAGFTLLGACDFEYPPGHPLRCNDWRLDLLG